MFYIGLLSKIFKNVNQKVYVQPVVKGINESNTSFFDFNIGSSNDVVISAIHTNANNMAMLNPKHIRRDKNGNVVYFPSRAIKNMLNYPNPYMNRYDFLYKVAYQREEKDNAFIFFDRKMYQLYPLKMSDVHIIEDGANNLFVRLYFRNGSVYILPFEDLIVIRKHFNKRDLWGDNSNALELNINALDTMDKGLISAIKKSANLRGILKWKSVLKKEDIDKHTQAFVDDYLNISNDGGVASTDPRFEFEQLKQEPYLGNKPQMESAKDRIYSYYNVNEKIIKSQYNENEWNAYYKNVIEPFAIQLSLEFTKKIFSETERDHGNEIIFESNRLQYASNNTKVSVSKLLTDIGAASLDDILDIFNMAPIGGEEGQRRVQTLNMVNANKADKYQLGEEGKNNE